MDGSMGAMSTSSTDIRPLISPDTLTTEQIAAILHIAPQTVGDYIAKGWLRATRVGRRWLVRQAEIDRILAEGTPRG
jgi:excisionase family DNA binding protein